MTSDEIRDIADILNRRANDIVSFRQDIEQSVSEATGKPIRLQKLPGSVQLALDREIDRLRILADKLDDVTIPASQS